MAYLFRMHTLLPALALTLTACSGDDSATSDATTAPTGSTSTASTSDATETGTTGTDTTGTTTQTTEGTTDPGTGTTMEGTGNASDSDGDCVQESTPLGSDESSPLGFSADEALVGLLGDREGTLTWVDELIISEEFRGQDLPITLAINYDGGEVHYISAMDSGEFPDPSCVNRLEIGVTVDLASDGGEFSETRDALVWTDALGGLQLKTVDLIPPGLSGSLDTDALMGLDLTLESLDLSASLSADEGLGGVNGEASDPGLGSIGYGSLASFAVGAPQ